MANNESKAWTVGPDHREACLACKGETKRITIRPFDDNRTVWFYTCCSCGYTVGLVRNRPPVSLPADVLSEEPMSIIGRAQAAADDDDRAYEAAFGAGRATCDPVY
jgi:hypothetical protein